MPAQSPAALLARTGILKGSKRCKWQHMKKNTLLLTTNPGTKETSYLLLYVKYLQGNSAQWKKLRSIQRYRLNGLSMMWVTGRMLSGRSALTAYV